MRLKLQRTMNAQSTTHHHAEKPNMKSKISESHAPTRPPEFLMYSTLALCDHPGSALLKVIRMSARYRASATTTSHQDSRSKAAILGGSGFSAERATPVFSLNHIVKV